MAKTHNLSDGQLEFQVVDRLSFRRVLNISFSDAVPDCKPVWAFRELLHKDSEDRSKKIFELFLSKLNQDGLIIAKEGKMIDAILVSVPVQRTRGRRTLK